MDTPFPMLAPGSRNAPGDEIDTAGGLPRIRREPPIQIAPAFSTVPDCTATITELDFGRFQIPSWLIEQMQWNSRLRGVLETRMNGLIGTEIRWEPSRQNDVSRRAARDIIEDWPLIVNAATRKQLSQWGLLLGVGVAQKHWYQHPETGRWIPRLEVYHPQWVIWDWYLRAYRIWTLDGWALVPSPALSVPGEEWQPSYSVSNQFPDTLRRWVIHEPFGQHSWRNGLVHALWRPWLGHEMANRDMSRGSEKMGLGIVKITYPKTTDAQALALLIQKLRTLGTESAIPVQQWVDSNGDKVGYDVTPFEWSGVGFDTIKGTKESNAADMAVLMLGHNTTAETKGASVGASAQVGNIIRGDIRVGDTYGEFSTIYSQVIRDWAEINYGDAGAAPLNVYVTDPPEANLKSAQTLFNVANAVDKMRASSPGVDFDELYNRFRVPLQSGGAKVKPPEPAPVGGGLPKPKREPAEPPPADDAPDDARKE